MIRTKADLHYYLQCDALGSKKPDPTVKLKRRKLSDWLRAKYLCNRNPAWELLQSMRLLGYYSCVTYQKSVIGNVRNKCRRLYYFRRMLRLRRETNIIVNSQQLGAGAYIPYNNVVITPCAEIGDNCMIESGVVMGITGGVLKGPRIGNNVFIGTGAKLIGDIEIADGVCIGANAVVTKSCLEPNATLAGVPARVISHKGSEGFLVKATEVWAQQNGERTTK